MTDTGTARVELRRMQRFARLLDSSIRLPGGYRIGWDGLIGLVPGIGDAVGAALSAYLVIRAARVGASTATLAKMMLNILLEAVLGAVPLLGDVMDFTWKANERNMRLLRTQLDRQPAGGGAPGRLAGAAVFILSAFLAALVALLVLALRLLLALAGAIPR